jgi:PDZ domain-containing protein
MHRRTLTLYISAVAVIIAILVAERLPVPYVILGPGPTLNTLGKDQSGKPLITITGHPVYPTNGHLNMVSITYEGGPGHQFNVFTALRAWLDPHEAVVPQSEIFAPGQSQQQVTQQDQVQMTSSQQSATAAALHQQGIAYKTVAQVVSVKPGLPAYGKLKPGDLITAVDGQPVTGTSQLTALIKAHAGKPITLTFLRGGTTQHTQLTAQQVDGRPVLGVEVQDLYQFPFKVTIQIGQIGGPSAGTMFALGIIDKISTENLTGGKFIAGTGEISANGVVSPIGGIQQKMIAARDAGATVFLAPAGNCSDTSGAVPAGLRVVKISTLSGAVSALENIKAGKPVPSC